MRPWLSLSAAVVVSLFALHASANSGGITGKSGKGGGATCGGCHTGGTAPTVKIDGPDTLAAGASSDYTFTITTALAKGSCGIATDTGTLTAGAGLKVDSGELVQTAAIDATGGEAKFTFKLKAPSSGTKVKLWAAGLASDGAGATTGDADAKTVLEITVTGGGTAATSGGDDDDTKTTSSASSGSTKKKTSSSSSGKSGDDDGTSTGIPNSGCAAAPGNGDALSAFGLLVLLGVFLKATRRETRHS